MGDVTLSSSIRSNLLTLQGTADLVNRTNGRLATGRRVSSAIDDAVSYFQAKALTDRSADLNERKAGIDQGISTVKAAINGLESVEKILTQMKGVAMSAKSANTAERKNLSDQFLELGKQLDNLVNDTSYQGLNLISSTTANLKVEFSDKSGSSLQVSGVNVKFSALMGNNQFANVSARSAITARAAITPVPAGTATGTAASVPGAAAITAASAITAVSARSAYVAEWSERAASALLGKAWDATGTAAATSDDFNAVVKSLETAITTVRTATKSLGNNVALLQTRFDFTKNYVNTMTEGADKLTLADMNEEGANLVSLQTRQQLGVQALAFAGQQEASVLRLFG